MKNFWVALIAVALVAGFTLSASAADIKFSGAYYVMGAYADNWNLNEDKDSASVYAQRLRVATAFKVAEGLTLNTRFDALEGRWGQYGYVGATTDRQNAVGKDGDDQNISFDRAWVSFAVPFGKFDVGRQNQNGWGTVFASDNWDADAIRYKGNFGPVEVGAFVEKLVEGYGWDDYATVQSNGGYNDGDRDNYGIYGTYKWNGGVAGLQIAYMNDKTEYFVDKTPWYKAQVWTSHLMSRQPSARFL